MFNKVPQMNDCRQLLAKNMKKYRKILGISQMALAERIGCSTTLVGNIEINKRFPSAANINKIARSLDVKIEDLFADEEPESMKSMVFKKAIAEKLKKAVSKAVDELL
jgi:transcriptional regulator with XRE-family HTH domain